MAVSKGLEGTANPGVKSCEWPCDPHPFPWGLTLHKLLRMQHPSKPCQQLHTVGYHHPHFRGGNKAQRCWVICPSFTASKWQNQDLNSGLLDSKGAHDLDLCSPVQQPLVTRGSLVVNSCYTDCMLKWLHLCKC